MNVELARYNIADINNTVRLGGDGFINGSDNRFPDYLNGLYNSSPTHQAIINDLVDYIYADGIKVDDLEKQKKIDRFFPKTKTKQIIRNVILQRSAPFEIIMSKLGNPLFINCLPPNTIRVIEMNDGKPTVFKYRKSWDYANYQFYKITREFHRFTKNKFEGLYYWYDSGTFDLPYGRPSYISGLNAIELEASIYQMHNHGVQNGMFPSMFISLETSGDDDQDRKTQDRITRSMSGSANAGKAAIEFRNAGTEPANIVIPNTTGIDKVYENQYQISEIGILKAHQIPSTTLISGLNQKPTGFGSAAEEMEFSLKILRKKKIEPLQDLILNEVLKPLFDLLEIEGAYFEQDKIEIEDTAKDIQEEKENGVVVKKPENKEDDIIIDPEAEAQKELSYNGAQIQSALNIVQLVQQGLITNEQGIIFFKEFLRIDENIASRIFKNEINLTTYLSKKKELEKWVNLGVDLEEFQKEWELIDEIEADPELEIERDKELEKLNKPEKLNTGTARPNSRSEQDRDIDGNKYITRYVYSGNLASDTREFCKQMVAAKKVYRKEDIEQMSASGVNSEFSPKGASKYDIFLWKGGVYCHHKWLRQTYKKKGTEGGIDINNPNAEKISTNQAQREGYRVDNDSLVSMRPIDTPTRGRLNFSKTIKEITEWLQKI